MDYFTTPLTFHLPIVDRLWFFEIIIGILALVSVNFIFKRIVKHVRHRSISLTSDWKEKIDQILFLPFHVLLWILGGTLVIEVLGKKFDFSFFESYIDAFRSTGFVLCVAWVLLRWKTVAQKQLMNKKIHGLHMDVGFLQVVGKLLSLSIIIISVMVILQVWGLNIAPLIAFGGIGAAAVGFSAKDVLANFFGGLMLHINRPFVIGDFINLPSMQLEGHVEEIGWNLTTVRDKSKRPVYLPNSTFSHAMVINSARMTHRRIEEKISIRFEDFTKIPSLVEEIKQAIAHHPDTDTHLPILVVFDSFGQFYLDLYIDFYTLQTKYDKYLLVKHEILMLVCEQLQRAEVELPSSYLAVEAKASV